MEPSNLVGTNSNTEALQDSSALAIRDAPVKGKLRRNGDSTLE
jgi:hypothetical protein